MAASPSWQGTAEMGSEVGASRPETTGEIRAEGGQETATPAPAPRLDGYTAEFYRFCSRGELRLQRCCDCGRWRHPPRLLCASCRSPRFGWERTAGRGRIYTWTVVHQAVHPAFAGQVPYALVVVELEEGPRLVTRVRDVAPDELSLGLEVVVSFEEVGPTVLPWFARPSAR
jgi:uncharacterized OB-fold protein